LAVVFEWDSRKEWANRRKHGVSFAEARSVFDNGLARIFNEDNHSNIEAREIIMTFLDWNAPAGELHGAAAGSGSNHQRARSY